MPYLNVDLDFFDHPKTVRLVNLLGNGAAELPLRLWAYCGKFHKRDGIMGRKSPAEIESIIRWWGEPGFAVRCLTRVGFLGKGRDGYYIHDWKGHQGHIHALAERNKKAAQSRWRGLRENGQKKASTVGTITMPLVQDGMPQPASQSVPILPDQKTASVVAPENPVERTVGFFLRNRGIPATDQRLLTAMVDHGAAANRLLDLCGQDPQAAERAITELGAHLDAQVQKGELKHWQRLEAIVRTLEARKERGMRLEVTR